jgi:hypothetical protein
MVVIKNILMYKEYVDIIKEELDELVGSLDELSIECDDKDISIMIDRSPVIQTRMSGESHFLLKPFHHKNYDRLSFEEKIIAIDADCIKIKDLNIYRNMIRNSIINDLIPTIKDYYMQNYIKKLPTQLTENKIINFSKLTAKWLKKTFNEVSEDVMNGESMENLKITKTDTDWVANFNVDCGRRGIHKNNYIKINNRGGINVGLCEAIEVGGIESGVTEEIKKYLNI